ncbi:MAG: transposase [Candidatus Gracilibacteria bacterium]
MQKQYKEYLSDFREWEEGLITDMLVYPGNFGPRMSIDETSLQNGELYTIITNKDAKGKKGVLAALIKGTKASVVIEALRSVPVEIRMKVTEITLDLANNMDWICRESFPNAILTADRFHFQQIVTEGVQDIRTKLRREAIDEENAMIMQCREQKTEYKPFIYANGDTKKQLLARGRYLLFKPSGKWTVSQAERAKILFTNFPEIKKAYELTMYFRGIFEKIDPREKGKEKLDKWYEKINESSIPELISAANTIKANEGKILNYFYTRSTNASAESFNAKLKGFRSLLRGVGEINFFLFRVEKLFA